MSDLAGLVHYQIKSAVSGTPVTFDRFSNMALVIACRNGNAARGMWIVDTENNAFPIFTTQGSVTITCSNHVITASTSLSYGVPVVVMQM